MIPYLATQSIRRLYFAAVFALLGLVTGCDRYLINICNFRDEWPGCREEVVDASAVDLLARGADSPLGPLRKFEWRAGINNNQNQKFVGILQRDYAVSVSRVPTMSFSALRFHLDRPRDQMQLEQVACPKCPLPTNINLPNDSVYLTSDAAPVFWLLRTGTNDESHTIKENGDLTQIDGNLDLKTNRRPFFHPILDASLIPTKSTSKSSSDSLRLTVGTTPYVSTHTEYGTITAAMIGDIDATDPVKNGIEVVRFAGATVTSVYHHDLVMGKQSLDADLQKTLNDEIGRRIVSLDENIGAAYVNDLNKDGLLDFVFSLGVNVFVSSYRGVNIKFGLPNFESWPETVLSVPAGEKIQSIIAMDISKDGYPELIVVTDKFVHFYLNTPK